MNKLFLFSMGLFLFSLTACSDLHSDTIQQTKPSDPGYAALAYQRPTGFRPDPALPSFMIRNTRDQLVNLQEFKGKKVFVNLWATWCPPCRAEIPSIEKLFRTVDTSRVSFVLVSLDNQFEKAIKFMLRHRLHLPVYYPAENLPDIFRVDAIPSTFIFDEKGELIQEITGGMNYNAETFRTLLR
ncbi:MAG: TlpA family protein disulfide reductase [Flavisolibacter sp.]